MNVIKIVKSSLHNVFTFYSGWACTWWFQIWCKTISTLEVVNLYIPHYDQPQKIRVFKELKCYHWYYMFKWTTLHLSIFFLLILPWGVAFPMTFQWFCWSSNTFSRRLTNAFVEAPTPFSSNIQCFSKNHWWLCHASDTSARWKVFPSSVGKCRIFDGFSITLTLQPVRRPMLQVSVCVRYSMVFASF